jgi:hypothetical protein
MAQEDSGLVRRGLVLVAGIGVLAVVVLSILLNRPGGGPRPQETEASKLRPSGPGWEIRYNATLSLARRGSPKVPLDTLLEMLDEPQQMANFRAPLEDGSSVPDEVAARRTVLNTLDALAAWWRKLPAPERARFDQESALQGVRAAVDRLAESPNATLWTKAKQTRQVLSSAG